MQPATSMEVSNGEAILNDPERGQLRMPLRLLESVSIQVCTEDGTTTSMWKLVGFGGPGLAPLADAPGADELRDNLIELPGFNTAAYRNARRAEENGQDGHFVCWQKNR